MMKASRLFFLILLLSGYPSFAHADSYSLDDNSSLIGAVVYKGGFGAVLAHNHLISARNVRHFDLRLGDTNRLETGTFSASVLVSDVVADDPQLIKTWNSKLEEMGLVTKDTPLSEIKESDRKDIEESLRGKDQLDGEKFPQISVKLINLSPMPSMLGKVETSHKAKLAIEFHGVSKEVEWPALVKFEGESGTVTTAGPLKFTNFGIKPISIGFGAIQNKDEFKFFAHLIVRKGSK